MNHIYAYQNDGRYVNVLDARTGGIVRTLSPALGSNDTITGVSGDTTGAFITVTCSNGATYIYKMIGEHSWIIHKYFV